jgi:hypothetical protein
MSLVSVPAIYDGKTIQLTEPIPLSEPYRVVVTFLEPIREATAARSLERFLASFGAWKDDRPIEETLRSIFDARRSRTEPPSL